MNNINLIAVFAIIFAWMRLSDASLCKPLSNFRVDCNTCTCSANGRSFSCSNYICPQVNIRDDDKFIVEYREDGHEIIRPRTPWNDRDLVLTNDKTSVKGSSTPYP